MTSSLVFDFTNSPFYCPLSTVGSRLFDIANIRASYFVIPLLLLSEQLKELWTLKPCVDKKKKKKLVFNFKCAKIVSLRGQKTRNKQIFILSTVFCSRNNSLLFDSTYYRVLDFVHFISFLHKLLITLAVSGLLTEKAEVILSNRNTIEVDKR